MQKHPSGAREIASGENRKGEAGKMAREVKALAAKLKSLNSIAETHIMERKDQFQC